MGAGDDAGDVAEPGTVDDRASYRLEWKRTTVDGRPAEYGEAGTGAPALFLHGWGLDHKAYKRALSRLVRAGLHVYAPALPGFGGTAALRDQPASLSSYGGLVGLLPRDGRCRGTRARHGALLRRRRGHRSGP